ncbi:MAG: hypothetical protein FJ146_11660 [Deltaproteobacteria bacterium]|nr:hypothetical protein [Deltaproteobacteria bacterium]
MPQHVKIYDQAVPADLCERIIQRFDQDKRVSPDPQPDYSTRSYLNISQEADWLPISRDVCRVVNSLMARYFERPEHLAHGTYHEWSDDGYVACRYDVGDTCILHIDGQTAVEPHNALRIATVVMYLNDVPVGGETYFPEQDLKVSPRQGRAVVFPVGYTHPHEVLAASSPRYIVQTWITDPNFVVHSS